MTTGPIFKLNDHVLIPDIAQQETSAPSDVEQATLEDLDLDLELKAAIAEEEVQAELETAEDELPADVQVALILARAEGVKRVTELMNAKEALLKAKYDAGVKEIHRRVEFARTERRVREANLIQKQQETRSRETAEAEANYFERRDEERDLIG